MSLDVPLEPIIDWIGDVPIYHGERDDCEACLCGHVSYLTCPDWPEGGIADLMVSRNDDGTINVWRSP